MLPMISPSTVVLLLEQKEKMAKSFNTSSNAMSKEFTKWYYKGFTVRKISRKCCSKIWYVHYKDYKQITYNG